MIKTQEWEMLHSEDRKLSEKTGEAINFISHWKNRDHGWGTRDVLKIMVNIQVISEVQLKE